MLICLIIKLSLSVFNLETTLGRFSCTVNMSEYENIACVVVSILKVGREINY